VFDKVKTERSYWYWFTEGQDQEAVYKVARDGSGGLWVDSKGHGVSMEVFLKDRRCLGPVAPRVMKAKEKRTKIHLDKGGIPLCECDGRVRNFAKVHFELTLHFNEVTCKKCNDAIEKASRVMGY
jgi:hypothetical protein